MSRWISCACPFSLSTGRRYSDSDRKCKIPLFYTWKWLDILHIASLCGPLSRTYFLSQLSKYLMIWISISIRGCILFLLFWEVIPWSRNGTFLWTSGIKRGFIQGTQRPKCCNFQKSTEELWLYIHLPVLDMWTELSLTGSSRAF